MYDPSWGRFKSIIEPAPGNHEYGTSGATGYFDYFNGSGVQTGQAGDRSKGYYSWNLGSWHFVALNSSSGSNPNGPDGNEQAWLAADPRGEHAALRCRVLASSGRFGRQLPSGHRGVQSVVEHAGGCARRPGHQRPRSQLPALSTDVRVPADGGPDQWRRRSARRHRRPLCVPAGGQQSSSRAAGRKQLRQCRREQRLGRTQADAERNRLRCRVRAVRRHREHLHRCVLRHLPHGAAPHRRHRQQRRRQRRQAASGRPEQLGRSDHRQQRQLHVRHDAQLRRCLHDQHRAAAGVPEPDLHPRQRQRHGARRPTSATCR